MSKKIAAANIFVGCVKKKRLNRLDLPVFTNSPSLQSKKNNAIAAQPSHCPIISKDQRFGGKSLQDMLFAIASPSTPPRSGRAVSAFGVRSVTMNPPRFAHKDQMIRSNADRAGGALQRFDPEIRT